MSDQNYDGLLDPELPAFGTVRRALKGQGVHSGSIGGNEACEVMVRPAAKPRIRAELAISLLLAHARWLFTTFAASVARSAFVRA